MKRFCPVILTLAILVPSCAGRRHTSQEEPRGPVTDTVKVEREEVPEPLPPVAEVPVTAEEPDHSTKEPVKTGDAVVWDHTVHDFGDILVDDGPVSCTFVLKNTGKDPVTILEVVTSCGCTDAEWTREDILPGKTGKISATYKNEDGPVYFDKNLTVWLSVQKKPILLHLRGQVHARKQPLEELYGSVRRGPLGLKSDRYKIGNLEQGESRSEQTTVANLGTTPVTVSFKDVSGQLSVTVDPNPIPAGSTATLSATVRSDREVWGRHDYTATPVIDGKAYGPLTFWAITKENFSSWTREQKENASQPIFTESTASIGVVGKGKDCEVTFHLSNKGKSTFICHSVEADRKVEIDPVPDLEPGESGSFKVRLNTSDLPEGEAVVYLTLITNSPLRPIVNLFIVGEVK